MPPEAINVGIVGFGFTAKTFHAPFLKQLQSLFRVVSISCRAGKNPDDDAKASFPSAAFEPPEKVLANPAVELVFILTMNSLHYPLAKTAIENGKHVLVEKPFTVTTQEGQHLVELANIRKVVLTCFHNRRLDADFLTLKSLLSSSALGSVKYFESRYDRFRPDAKPNRAWREEAGAGTGVWGPTSSIKPSVFLGCL